MPNKMFFLVQVTISDEQTDRMLDDGTKRKRAEILDSGINGLSFRVSV
jgi:hypothetical protein